MSTERFQSDNQKHFIHIKWMLFALVSLLIIYTLYFAKTLLLPIILSGFLALLANPAVYWLACLGINRAIGAAIVMILIIGTASLLIVALAEPASKWLDSIPVATEKVSEQITSVTDSIGAMSNTPMSQSEVQEVSENLVDGTLDIIFNFVLEATPVFIAQLISLCVLTYFFLVYGRSNLLALISIQKRFSRKRVILNIIRGMVTDISRYVLIVSVINFFLGLATAMMLYLVGVEDPLLWGTMIAILNFAPYVGPILFGLLLTLVGFTEYSAVSEALTPVALFFLINLVESQFVTPMTLGRQLRLNPLLVLLSLLIAGWLWGVVGMLVAVPLLVCVKSMVEQSKHFRFMYPMLEAC